MKTQPLKTKQVLYRQTDNAILENDTLDIKGYVVPIDIAKHPTISLIYQGLDFLGRNPRALDVVSKFSKTLSKFVNRKRKRELEEYIGEKSPDINPSAVRSVSEYIGNSSNSAVSPLFIGLGILGIGYFVYRRYAPSLSVSDLVSDDVSEPNVKEFGSDPVRESNERTSNAENDLRESDERQVNKVINDENKELDQ